jgi:hypothetical protein
MLTIMARKFIRILPKLLSYYYRKLLLNTFNKPIVRKWEELLYLHFEITNFLFLKNVNILNLKGFWFSKFIKHPTMYTKYILHYYLDKLLLLKYGRGSL